MSSLSIESVNDGKGGLTVKLAGQVDELADYGTIKTTGVKRVAFDFEKIKLINSTGLQRWIQFLNSIDKGVAIAFVRCSIRVITQINMFPGFLGGRQVAIESFFAPYFCEACDASRDLLLDASQQFASGKPPAAPKMKCPTCAGPAEFDGIEKKYFMFLKS